MSEEVIREIMRNQVLSVPTRLGIMLYLLPRGKAYFTEIQQALNLTPGNLWSHIRKLEDAGYVKVLRYLEDRPRTVVKVTKRGIDEVTTYLSRLLIAAENALKSTEVIQRK